jgi:hypothetical protein
VFFANIGGGWFDNQGYKFATSSTENVRPIVNYLVNPLTGATTPVPGDERTVSGFRLQDGRASYGLGLETFALGFPIHFDWSWRTLFNKDWEDVTFAYNANVDGAGSGHEWFRKPRFAVWIGYDF